MRTIRSLGNKDFVRPPAAAIMVTVKSPTFSLLVCVVPLA